MNLSAIFRIAFALVTGGGIVWLVVENADLKHQLAHAAALPGRPYSPSPPLSALSPTSPAPGRETTPGGPGEWSLQPHLTPRQTPPLPSTNGAVSTIIASQADGGWLIRDAQGGQSVALSAEEAARLAGEIQASRAERSSKLAGGPSWSPGQAAGPPDTPNHGDHSTAWASQSPDAGAEWLKTKFDQSVEIAEINIHESFNPGAVSKVSVIQPDGSTRVIWEGTGSAESDLVERAIQVPPGVRGDQVLIEMDTSRVPGWNEIDAVEIVGRDGSRQWAAESSASSYYGNPAPVEMGFRTGFVPGRIDLPLRPRGQGP